MNIRTVDIQKDKQTLLDFHCVINYESGSPILRKKYTFEQFGKIWMKGKEPNVFFSALEVSLKDSRTIVEIWEDDDGTPIAYVRVGFEDWPDYKATGAEIRDIMVAKAYQRKGIATQIINRVEKLARERGATLLRSGTVVQNMASRELHAKLGFSTSWMQFEKEL